MRNIKEVFTVDWPQMESAPDNFIFSTVHPDGVFQFEFKYFNERWNGWVTLPDSSVRTIGVLPGVPSWTGFLDYGIIFSTELPSIDRNSLLLTTLCIIIWE